jgi:hypothetical protein
MNSLTLFDKIHLAECAARRANIHFMNNERFDSEYDTVRLWKMHNTYNVKVHNRVITYNAN